ncbi:MAG: exonuclease subunit SbcD, partial [Deltaproteobacteria bacterium]|nr:exonuclease subunit SbcD [Deltaproteobacteria bacterium]
MSSSSARSLRLLHTADWHLGHTLKGHDRAAEHDVFLRWLVATIAERAIDVVVIAGDVFDQANPSARAQAQLYEFFAAVHRLGRDVDVVVVAGNHDSAARIDAPHPVLSSLRVHAVGAATPEQRARLVADVTRADGTLGARVVAMPFLRPGDLLNPRAPVAAHPGGAPATSAMTPVAPASSAASYADGVAALYRAVVDSLPPGPDDVALVLVGHLHVQGGDLSPESERRLVIGGEEALPARVFPDAAYVALGHLHKAQTAGAPHIRYSGSPLPLSFTERDYEHQVLEVVFDSARLTSVTSIPVPRPSPVWRVPASPEPLSAVLLALQALDAPPVPRGLEPLVEVQLREAFLPTDL